MAAITDQTTLGELQVILDQLDGRFPGEKADLHIWQTANEWRTSTVSLGGSGPTLAAAIDSSVRHSLEWRRRASTS